LGTKKKCWWREDTGTKMGEGHAQTEKKKGKKQIKYTEGNREDSPEFTRLEDSKWGRGKGEKQKKKTPHPRIKKKKKKRKKSADLRGTGGGGRGKKRARRKEPKKV